MKQNVNQQARRQACAAAPCNERFTPQERECWHLRAINRLCNTVADLRKTLGHSQRLARVQTVTIMNQRRTLYEMNVRANARNREIERLQAELTAVQTNTTPIPQFAEGDNDDASTR